MTEKLYTIQPIDFEQFVVGVTGDGTQMLMGLQFPNLVALSFDPSGRLIRTDTRPLPKELRSADFNPDEPVFRATVVRALAEWGHEIGFMPAAIRVQQFRSTGAWIDDLPWHYREFKRDPVKAEPDDGGRAEIARLLERWESEGRFVFVWGKDYWMNNDGSIHST